jgi:hypothetical protein
MGMSKSSVTAGSTFDMEAPGVTHERILRVLGMTQRPLKSGELANALGCGSKVAARSRARPDQEGCPPRCR